MTFTFGAGCLLVSGLSANDAMSLGGFTSTNIGVTAFCFALALFFFGLTWMIRVHVLPFQFVADSVRRECAYRWGGWHAVRVHISETTKFSAQLSLVSLRPYEGRWKWSIDAVETTTGKRRRVFSSSKDYWDKESALADSKRYVVMLAEYFSLPWEVLAHSGKPRSWG